MFTLSETHLHEENIQSLLNIARYSMVYRNQTHGISAFIADRVQWVRRHDLESPHLDIWTLVKYILRNSTENIFRHE